MTEADAYGYRLAKAAHRALTVGPQKGGLPRAVAFAVLELIEGDLTKRPRQVGKPLVGDLAGRWVARRGTYRVVYTIDDTRHEVTVLDVDHRRDVYRPH